MSPRPEQADPIKAGPIRRTVVLLLSLALVAGGGWLLGDLLLVGRWAGVRLGSMGAFLVFIGGAILWEDFLEPLLRQRRAGRVRR